MNKGVQFPAQGQVPFSKNPWHKNNQLWCYCHCLGLSKMGHKSGLLSIWCVIHGIRDGTHRWKGNTYLVILVSWILAFSLYGVPQATFPNWQFLLFYLIVVLTHYIHRTLIWQWTWQLLIIPNHVVHENIKFWHKLNIRDAWIWSDSLILTYIDSLITQWCNMIKWIIKAHNRKEHLCSRLNILEMHIIILHHCEPS